jgi:hypothetical protein
MHLEFELEEAVFLVHLGFLETAISTPFDEQFAMPAWVCFLKRKYHQQMQLHIIHLY